MKKLFIVAFMMSIVGLSYAAPHTEQHYNLAGDADQVVLDVWNDYESKFGQALVGIAYTVSETVKAGYQSATNQAIVMQDYVKAKLGYTAPKQEKSVTFLENCKNKAQDAWNADLFGYKNGGKYAIVATGASAVLLAVAYTYSAFSKKSIEDQISILLQKAQCNPNIILAELPTILAQCQNDNMRVEVLEYVLSNVKITSEIAAAYHL